MKVERDDDDFDDGDDGNDDDGDDDDGDDDGDYGGDDDDDVDDKQFKADVWIGRTFTHCPSTILNSLSRKSDLTIANNSKLVLAVWFHNYIIWSPSIITRSSRNMGYF